MTSRWTRIRLREIDDIGGAKCFIPMKGEVYLAELEFFKASRPQYDRFYCVNMHEEITLILLKISSSRVRDLILLSDRQHSSRTRTGIHWTRRKNRACCERCFTSRVEFTAIHYGDTHLTRSWEFRLGIYPVTVMRLFPAAETSRCTGILLHSSVNDE